MFNLAHGYARNQMSAYVELQEAEFAAAEKGFTAVKHQREVGVVTSMQLLRLLKRGFYWCFQRFNRGRTVLNCAVWLVLFS